MRHYTLFDQIVIKLENFNNHLHPTHERLSEKLNASKPQWRSVRPSTLFRPSARCARSEIEAKLNQAAEEEQAHLEWCKNRIEALQGRTSWLNTLWAMGSFGIGVAAGFMGDKISLGFLAETERQVVHHLDKHLKLLPEEEMLKAVRSYLKCAKMNYVTRRALCKRVEFNFQASSEG